MRHDQQLLVPAAIDIPVAIAWALITRAGLNNILIGLSATFMAARTNLASSAAQQPPFEHPLSWTRQARSSLSTALAFQEPLYLDAETFWPPVQLGPHQLPCILTRLITCS